MKPLFGSRAEKDSKRFANRIRSRVEFLEFGYFHTTIAISNFKLRPALLCCFQPKVSNGLIANPT